MSLSPQDAMSDPTDSLDMMSFAERAQQWTLAATIEPSQLIFRSRVNHIEDSVERWLNLQGYSVTVLSPAPGAARYEHPIALMVVSPAQLSPLKSCWTHGFTIHVDAKQQTSTAMQRRAQLCVYKLASGSQSTAHYEPYRWSLAGAHDVIGIGFDINSRGCGAAVPLHPSGMTRFSLRPRASAGGIGLVLVVRDAETHEQLSDPETVLFGCDAGPTRGPAGIFWRHRQLLPHTLTREVERGGQPVGAIVDRRFDGWGSIKHSYGRYEECESGRLRFTVLLPFDGDQLYGCQSPCPPLPNPCARLKPA